MEAVVTTEEAVETAEDEGAVGEEEEVSNSSRVQAPLHPPLLATKGQNTQIFRQENGKDARCIINSGNKVTFVLSQRRARGKMFTLPDQTNETGTNPLTVN